MYGKGLKKVLKRIILGQLLIQFLQKDSIRWIYLLLIYYKVYMMASLFDRGELWSLTEVQMATICSQSTASGYRRVASTHLLSECDGNGF